MDSVAETVAGGDQAAVEALEKAWRTAAIRAAKSRVEAEVDRIAARRAEQAYLAATWVDEGAEA